MRFETKEGDNIKHFNKFIGIIAFIVVWQIVSFNSGNPAVPSITKILKELAAILADNQTIGHITASIKIIILGILIAIIFGICLGILMSAIDQVRVALMPLIESLRGVAALTLFPLLIVTMGLGDSSRIFVIFWTAWPSVLISTINGLDINRTLIEAAQNLGANKYYEYRYVRIPLAIPTIISGIRIGISGGFISLIAAEMLGATKGIGYMLQWSSQAFNFKAVYAYIIIIAAIGGLINWTMLKIEKRIKERF